MPPQLSDSTAPLIPHEHRSKKNFSVSAAQLCQLVDLKHPSLLADLGGTHGICQALKVDPTVGLFADETFDPCYGIVKSNDTEPFAERKALFGRNEIPEAPAKTIWSLLWAAYNDQTLIMLTIASVVSLAVGLWEDNSANHPVDEPKVGWVDGVAILVAVAVVVITNAMNDYEKEKQFRKLNAKKEERPVKIMRDGIAQQIHIQEVVVGDIMFVEPGDMLNVDCLYIEGHNLRCDESTATGESHTVKKNTDLQGDCVLLSGSKILQGVAKVVVIAVGTNSFYGRAMTLMRNSSEDQTPLQLKLNVLADQIAKFGFAAAGLMFGVLLLKLVILSTVSNHWVSTNELLSELITMVIQAITVIVVAVPEGLPMAVTLALAFATTEMLKDNNLVRHLSACETMGNATAVCSDKTGTLTENKMTVITATLADKQFTKVSEMQRWRYQVSPIALDLLVEGIAINSTAFEGRSPEGVTKFVGSTTESALIDFSRKLGYSYQQIRSSSKIANVYPFNSTVKSMTTVIQVNDSNVPSPDRNTYRLYSKGAPESIIKACTHYIDLRGKVKPLDQCTRLHHEMLVNEYAERSLRTLALAYRDVDHATFSSFHPDDAPVNDLIFLGIVGIQDQLRPGVIESVQAFRRAGVFIRMITGDNIETAKAIAKECGILTAGGIAMTGPDFRALSTTEQQRVIPRLQVLARSSPIDKTIIVSRLQEMNEVVAMTGDGTNDGPALKMANVGFAMGITGTEVAKEASDIILMDDNFNSILQALKWGRAVNDGVRKFLTFQLTVNVAAVVLSFVSAVVSEKSESILSAVQLLWVNMIMDTFAALALATEPLSDELINRRPLRKDSSLINWRMSRMIIGQAIFQIFVNLLLMTHGPSVFGLSNSVEDNRILRTMVFNVFVFLQVFNELNCRRIDDNLNILRGVRHDYLFLAIQAFTVIGQVLIVQYGGLAFKTVPLTTSQWLFTIGIGSLSIPAGTLIRLLPNHIPYFWSENNDDEFVHTVSYSRLRWEAAVNHILRDVKTMSDDPKAVMVAHKLIAASKYDNIHDYLQEDIYAPAPRSYDITRGKADGRPAPV
ncbi:PMCA-type calcium-translocating P-type ATPase [Radiomyces spectabilis]|uniref:PMCA-type calcium-translocating P-type ATPase n=1 Tax=Radiomyces spectabilis TaxID=64574 RepID=UPI00221E5AD9|nr:PMCA-type calcium-translocating P-type ATPase [Radiomyces spectabilis]KAI8374538.1 PMCA-type calcium-translocating P-type ATPase [Radiomyces spectabilis]